MRDGYAPGPRHSTGRGPGDFAPDGSAVDFYRHLPPGRTSLLVHEALPEAASVLDLGAGVGRLAHALIERGHAVVAVDESPEMLAHVRGAETICAPIEDLRLDRRFDAVLLASHIINAPCSETRHEILSACRHHVRKDGAVLLERYTRRWVDTVEPFTRDYGTISIGLRDDFARPEPGLLTLTYEYRAGEKTWTQTFTTRGLDDDELSADLSRVGLRLDRWLNDDGTWVRAVVDGRPAAGRGLDTP